MMTVPPVLLTARSRSPLTQQRIGQVLTVLAALALAVAASLDVYAWSRGIPAELTGYAGQRVAFFLATCIDVPLPHLLVAGLVCWAVGRRRGRSGATAACNLGEAR